MDLLRRGSLSVVLQSGIRTVCEVNFSFNLATDENDTRNHGNFKQQA